MPSLNKENKRYLKNLSLCYFIVDFLKIFDHVLAFSSKFFLVKNEFFCLIYIVIEWESDAHLLPIMKDSNTCKAFWIQDSWNNLVWCPKQWNLFFTLWQLFFCMVTIILPLFSVKLIPLIWFELASDPRFFLHLIFVWWNIWVVMLSAETWGVVIFDQKIFVNGIIIM